MEWHINELSLDRQYANARAFRAELEPLLILRLQEPILRNRLYCSRMLYARPVTHDENLQQAVIATRDGNFIRLVLEWMAKSGPFWDDARQPNEDDYFTYKAQDVTDLGLGEAARRKIAGIDANTFSFQGNTAHFAFTPVPVDQGLPQALISTIPIDNLWDVARLATAAQSCRVYESWLDVQVEILRRYRGIIFAGDVIAAMQPEPFSMLITRRIFELLHVLDQIVSETEGNGSLSPAGMELLKNHFTGDKAWFTDESDKNKIKFEQDMKFTDPSNPAQKIFCHWHGKIKTPQVRIHFEWPRPVGQRMIKVLYIGPKITKD